MEREGAGCASEPGGEGRQCWRRGVGSRGLAGFLPEKIQVLLLWHTLPTPVVWGSLGERV